MFTVSGTGHKVQGGGGGGGGGGGWQNLFQWRWIFVDPPLNKE